MPTKSRRDALLFFSPRTSVGRSAWHVWPVVAEVGTSHLCSFGPSAAAACFGRCGMAIMAVAHEGGGAGKEEWAEKE